MYQIEIRAISELYDSHARQIVRDIRHLPRKPLPSLEEIFASTIPLSIHTAQLYHLNGGLAPGQLDQLILKLLVDPVTQIASLSQETSRFHCVDVFFHSGVTDTLAQSVMTGAEMLGLNLIGKVETGHRYFLDARLSPDEVHFISRSLLFNPVIQSYSIRLAGTDVSAPSRATQEETEQIGPACQTIPISAMNDEQLLEVSKQGLLALNLDEMRTIQRHFQEQDREPTDVELETLAQTWSEHCSHKTFRATVHYRELAANGTVISERTIPNLLKYYLMKATEEVRRPWLVSAFSDNAGIVRFTDTQDIAFKVETHNHPSAIEPFGGANTGVGGVIRDVVGVSAQPIACTDILCFGPLETDVETLPPGILAPRRIASGVVNGVRDYGNKMGIPTVNGSVLYHPGFLYNPLVFCGCLGILPHGSHPRAVQPGDRIVVLGGRTGRDGIHGATFSSGEMSSEINARAGAAVQIGAPITEKKVTDVIIQARDHQLYHAITDCGAGGFSSAVGEMGEGTGARVELAHAPLKYQGLAPWEIWLSEAQERMVLAVPSDKLTELLEICEVEEVEASVIGEFTNDGCLTVQYSGQTVASLEMGFLHDGRPIRKMEAYWREQDPIRTELFHYLRPTATTPTTDANQSLLALLRHPTIASKEEIVRRYDHEVQGATVLKPLVGISGNGPGDAAVLQPLLDGESRAGIVLSNGVNPLYSLIDPYQMALNAVDEALRNLTAVGGDIEQASILDNFCWGSPTDPAQMGMLVRAVQGCHDAAIGFGTPFISGKDSLNNEYRFEGQRFPLIPTLVISAVGVIPDASQTVDMALKKPGNLLYQIGLTKDELGGSHYALIHDEKTDAVPQVDLVAARTSMKALGEAIRQGLISACHDLSEGGLAVAVAEMSLAGLLGADLDLDAVPHDISAGRKDRFETIVLFSESASRFLVEVTSDSQEEFETFLRAQNVRHIATIGSVTDSGRLRIRRGQQSLIDLPVASLQEAWKGEAL